MVKVFAQMRSCSLDIARNQYLQLGGGFIFAPTGAEDLDEHTFELGVQPPTRYD